MSKLINISDETYKKLKSIKGDNSFTWVVEKLLANKSNKEKVLSFAGKANFDEKDLKKIKKGWESWSAKYS